MDKSKENPTIDKTTIQIIWVDSNNHTKWLFVDSASVELSSLQGLEISVAAELRRRGETSSTDRDKSNDFATPGDDVDPMP